MIKRILMILIPLLIVGGVSYCFYSEVSKPVIPIYYGEAEPYSVDVYAKVPGILTGIYVVEGQRIQGGELVAQLDASTASLQLGKARLAQAAAQVNLDKADGTTRDEEIIIQENTIGELEQQKRKTETTLEGLGQVLAQSLLNSQSLKSVYEDQKKFHEDLLVLIEAGAETQKNVDAARLAMDKGKVAYDSSVLERLKIEKEIEGVEAQLQGLELQIASAMEQLSLMQQGYSEDDRTLAELQLEMAAVELQLIQLTLEDHRIHTYNEGVVESVNFDVGDVIAGGTPVVTLYEPNHLIVDLYVPEAELLNIEVGQKLKLTVEAASDLTAVGVVKTIATEAMFTPVNIVTSEERDRLVFKVEVDLMEADAIKPGMLLSTDLKKVE